MNDKCPRPNCGGTLVIVRDIYNDTYLECDLCSRITPLGELTPLKKVSDARHYDHQPVYQHFNTPQLSPALRLTTKESRFSIKQKPSEIPRLKPGGFHVLKGARV